MNISDILKGSAGQFDKRTKILADLILEMGKLAGESEEELSKLELMVFLPFMLKVWDTVLPLVVEDGS